MNERNLYIIRKNAALWQIVLKCSGKVQFSSLSRARCNDWLESNFPDNEIELEYDYELFYSKNSDFPSSVEIFVKAKIK